MSQRRSLSVAFLAAVLAAPIVVAFSGPRVALATHVSDPLCNDHDQVVYAVHVPQVTADGGSAQWRAVTLVANGWSVYPPGGFAAQVLWVGTDSRSADEVWVETGITDGWKGNNWFRFYSAHADTRINVYDELLYTGAPVPVVGNAYIFRAYSIPSPGTPLYQTRVTVAGTNYLRNWGGHSPNTVDFGGGFEIRYGGRQCENRVDATYVYGNTLRRKSDGVNITINNGTLHDDSTQGTIGWCAQPTTLRYWVHSVASTSVCP